MLKSFTTLEKNEIDSIAIGGFDGVHVAHQVLLSKLTTEGALLIIHRGGLGLTPKYERCHYHDKKCFFLELESIKQVEAEDFVTLLLQEFPNLQKIVVGYDFHFGKERRGDVHLLKTLFTGEVCVVDEVFHENISIHSKKIKTFLAEGNIPKANVLLGREYSIAGEVIEGQGIGKERLYPTLNITSGDFFLPKEGVYACHVDIEGKVYPSVVFIGKRLSTDGDFSIEVHLLDEDFEQEVKKIRVSFVDFLRENRKFEDLGELKRQITQDIKEAKLTL
jgi:riboflavin kinase/FMN adenylyltransferase